MPRVTAKIDDISKRRTLKLHRVSTISTLFMTTLSGLMLACGGGEPASGQPQTESPNPPSEVIGGCMGDCGPSTRDFFSNEQVADLKLTIDDATLKSYGYEPGQWLDLLWDKWNNHCGPYDWVPVTMTYESPDGNGNTTLEKVAMRLRGTKSRGVNRLQGFKLDFTKSLPKDNNRRFAGLSRVNALSNEGDDSNMLQCMGYKLMRDFGLEAPLCNHLRVFINGKLYGVMESVERAKDARFLKNHFETSNGFLYAASASCGYGDSLADLGYKGDTFDVPDYTKIYEVLRGTPQDAEVNLIPMLKCGDPAQTPDDEDFKTCISEWIDVEQWLREIAAESIMPSLEDFVGARRNYFLYFKPDAAAPHGGRMLVWGWDYDTVLQRATCYPQSCDPFTSVAGWFGPRGKRQPLLTRLTSVFKARYCELLNEYLDEVYDPTKVDEMASVIEGSMAEDTVTEFSAWQSEVTRMREYMVKHAGDARLQIAKNCEMTASE
ncbi:MAG TPA: CotH kinase family protein [Polyangiaceae bacterium]|nr:CotH kinase family protein [Polyangiaceae bacterium]